MFVGFFGFVGVDYEFVWLLCGCVFVSFARFLLLINVCLFYLCCFVEF